MGNQSKDQHRRTEDRKNDSAIDPGLAIGQRSVANRNPRGDENLPSSQRNPIAPAGTPGFKERSDAELEEASDDFSKSEEV